MSGTEGFNCMSEKLCVPQEHVCDGYPDCVIGRKVFDEMNCIPESGRVAKTCIHPVKDQRFNSCYIIEAPSCTHTSVIT